jgi:mediator of RNA polymerase II transcription subunit 27
MLSMLVYPTFYETYEFPSCHVSWYCRLALKAFTDQKRRFFPHLDDGSSVEPSKKRHCGPVLSEEFSDQKTVSDILMLLEKEVSKVKTSTYQRLDWMKRASVLPSESSLELSKDLSFGNKLRQGSTSNVSADKVSVIELLVPSIFRAIISLHPAGSTDPDAVAFFSPDEVINFQMQQLLSLRFPLYVYLIHVLSD